MNDPRFDYLAQNRDRIEKVCIESVQKAVNEQATDPIARVGELLLLHSPDPSTTPPSSALRIAELEKELATTKTELATANARIAELEAASDDTPLTFTCEDVTMFFLRINSWNGTTPLLVAAQHGDAAVVAKLLANGAQVDEAAVDGQTPLCASAAAGHEAVVGALLAKGAQVAKPNNDGDTPLSAAAQNGYEAVVKTLLANMAEQELAVAPRSAEETKVQEAERGLDSKLIDNLTSRFPNVSRVEAGTALLLEGGHAGRAAGALQNNGGTGLVVDHANKNGDTPLAVAAQKGHEAVVAALLAKGARVNKANSQGWMPLYIAAGKGHAAVVAELLAKGAQMNVVDADGCTPLLIAAQFGYEAVVAALLAKGAQADLARNDGATPLFIAAQLGHEAVAAALLAKGAQIDRADEDGHTPLYAAAQKGREAVVAALLAKGAQVDTANNAGVTPLTIAANNAHEVVVAALLAKGAQVDQADEDGWTPLSVAAQEGHEAVVAALLAKGAQVDKADNNGTTPLCAAAAAGHEAVVAALLAKGAQVDRADNDGDTPLSVARQEGHKNIVAMLSLPLDDKELEALFTRAMEKGLMNASARENLRENVRDGRFTAEHYKEVWRSRIGQMGSEVGQPAAGAVRVADDDDYEADGYAESEGHRAEAAAEAVTVTEPATEVIGKQQGGHWLSARHSLAFGLQEREHPGTVTVRVLRATDLLAADKGAKSDPYVVVKAAGGKKAKSSAKKGTVNPVWDETLKLSVSNANAPIQLQVWDHDKVGKNDLLGSAEISLMHCPPGIPTAMTVALSTQGAVQAVVTWESAEAEELTAEAAKAYETAKRKAAKEVEAMVAETLVDPELDELLRRAMEKGLMEPSAREEILKHLREGRFTAEHYKTMWRARLRLSWE